MIVYCLPPRQASLCPHRKVASRSREISIVVYNQFSSLVVVKIKHVRGWKYFCFETSNKKRKPMWDAKQVLLAAGVRHRIKSHGAA